MYRHQSNKTKVYPKPESMKERWAGGPIETQSPGGSVLNAWVHIHISSVSADFESDAKTNPNSTAAATALIICSAAFYANRSKASVCKCMLARICKDM